MPKVIKVGLIGFLCVGKTAMFNLIQGDDIPLDHLPSLFIQSKVIEKFKDNDVYICDFSGQERFTPLWTTLIKGAHIILLVTDSIPEIVLQTKRKFMELIKNENPDAIVYGIANKQDLPNAMKKERVAEVLGLEDCYGLCAIDQKDQNKLSKIVHTAVKDYTFNLKYNIRKNKAKSIKNEILATMRKQEAKVLHIERKYIPEFLKINSIFDKDDLPILPEGLILYLEHNGIDVNYDNELVRFLDTKERGE